MDVSIEYSRKIPAGVAAGGDNPEMTLQMGNAAVTSKGGEQLAVMLVRRGLAAVQVRFLLLFFGRETENGRETESAVAEGCVSMCWLHCAARAALLQ